LNTKEEKTCVSNDWREKQLDGCWRKENTHGGHVANDWREKHMHAIAERKTRMAVGGERIHMGLSPEEGYRRRLCSR
jgi:hypothetical protein